MHTPISELNSFCRCKDLIYVEEGVIEKKEVHWFLDSNNHRVFYTPNEISDVLHRNAVSSFENNN